MQLSVWLFECPLHGSSVLLLAGGYGLREQAALAAATHRANGAGQPVGITAKARLAYTGRGGIRGVGWLRAGRTRIWNPSAPSGTWDAGEAKAALLAAFKRATRRVCVFRALCMAAAGAAG